MSPKRPLGLFDACGVELEYMIVQADNLDVLPACHRVLARQTGCEGADVAEFDDVTWSNELVLHVIELKTSRPAPRLAGLGAAFQDHVGRINRILEPMGGALMPSAMHPWMDPYAQMRLWPHGQSEIYQALHRIFDCRGHGWANLQSAHLNLPFDGDEQFGRLHAAIRLVLPILPALAASSPVVEGRISGHLDARLEAYRVNCARIPSLTGQVIPEPVFTVDAYQNELLHRLYGDLMPHDPAGVLQEEWINARGAIARFDRNTIEIRVVDVQECPAADLAVLAAVTGVIRLLVDEIPARLGDQQRWGAEPLGHILLDCIRDADRAVISNTTYLRTLGVDDLDTCTAGELWARLVAQVDARDGDELAFCRGELDVILRKGPLARRIIEALRPAGDGDALRDVYRRLCDCLAAGTPFDPGN